MSDLLDNKIYCKIPLGIIYNISNNIIIIMLVYNTFYTLLYVRIWYNAYGYMRSVRVRMIIRNNDIWFVAHVLYDQWLYRYFMPYAWPPPLRYIILTVVGPFYPGHSFHLLSARDVRVVFQLAMAFLRYDYSPEMSTIKPCQVRGDETQIVTIHNRHPQRGEGW